MPERPRVLIEDWLPIDVLGTESQRERGASSALPPLYFLHVWWARRPLTASRGAILASLLPAWSEDWPPEISERFPTCDAYHRWFVRLCGVRGDTVAARQAIQQAKADGIQLKPSPYADIPRAFTVNPSPEDLAIMRALLEHTWGDRDLTVLDPMAGGGSIPFEALRYGFTTWANDLNPVAAIIQKATLEHPARFGLGLADDVREWGQRWCDAVQERLEPFFPREQGESVFAYLWARTVACPDTGKPVPLSPNWRLSDDQAVRLLTDPSWNEPRFEILSRPYPKGFDPGDGTVNRGVGRSPWTGIVIEGDYIKAEAQRGRLGQMLYSVVTKGARGTRVRLPTTKEREAILSAQSALERLLPSWIADDVVPSEQIPEGNKTPEPVRYGETSWNDMFSPRQLLAFGVYAEALRTLQPALRAARSDHQAAAVETYLALALDKALIYNNRHCRYDPGRGIRSVFDRHDFAFVWSHAEFDASANLLPWCIDQITGAYRGIVKLLGSGETGLWTGHSATSADSLCLLQGSATALDRVRDKSVALVCVDPPYYDNVMYAELSDFFYVWLKRTVGDVFPEWTRTALTDKDAEAVASPARFGGLGRNKNALAAQDYERKMTAAFREMHRVLQDDGVLTVMFTHKEVEAWDTLATSLIEAGFQVASSWPVHTESEHSLHQANKNAAASTILLTCRKRVGDAEGQVWWDDLKGEVRREARERAQEYHDQGIRGVDLYLGTFGPVLSIISRHWPVLTSEVDPRTRQPRRLRPEMALDLAREEVIGLRRRGLLLGRDVEFDPVTDWYLLAWDSFGAVEFPADEARKLALVLGMDLEGDLVAQHRVLRKKGSTVQLLRPAERRVGRGGVDPQAQSYETWLDRLHTAMVIYGDDGPENLRRWLRLHGLEARPEFRGLLQAAINAVPAQKARGEYVRPEAQVLEGIRQALFPDLEPAAAADEAPTVEQQRLF